MNQKAFTLIELLVVIAIIALLLAVIAPALRSAKEQARTIVCAAHMRGLGTAVAGYLESNDSRFHNITNFGLWNNPATGADLDCNDSLAYWGIAYSYYADKKEVFHCSAAKRVDMWCVGDEPYAGWDQVKLKKMFYFCHYGVNGYTAYDSTDKVRFRRITNFKVPASVIFCQDHIEQTLDGAYSDMFTVNASGINLSQWRNEYSAPDRYPECVSECFRHNRSSYARKNQAADAVEKGLSNNLWLDGHVSRINETLGAEIQYRWYTGHIVDPTVDRWSME